MFGSWISKLFCCKLFLQEQAILLYLQGVTEVLDLLLDQVLGNEGQGLQGTGKESESLRGSECQFNVIKCHS